MRPATSAFHLFLPLLMQTKFACGFGTESLSAGWCYVKTKDTSRTPVKPFLIETDSEGRVRLTVRTTTYNTWNYPIVSSSLVPEIFASAAAARTYAKEHFRAESGQFVIK